MRKVFTLFGAIHVKYLINRGLPVCNEVCFREANCETLLNSHAQMNDVEAFA
jgi:hypothetical protein